MNTTEFLNKSFLLLILGLFSCAQKYTGPGPNLKVNEEKKKEELKKFTIQERSIFTRGNSFELEGNDTSYTQSSMRSMMIKTSPESEKYFKRYDYGFWAYTIAIGAALGLLAAEVIEDNDEFESQTAVLSLLGFSWGAIFFQNSMLNSAAEQYNKDLKRQLSPTLTYQYSF